QTETEATGAPQKHHYTLNQQVGSITSDEKHIQLSVKNSIDSMITMLSDIFINQLDKFFFLRKSNIIAHSLILF
ncbi:hypothetical protein, partial [Klebsiella pneumoniae]|uniref:hypothetical protein n=1 Tax=Klebsiella pneumoniae TaxID=573 RepID=UPI002A5B0BD4